MIYAQSRLERVKRINAMRRSKLKAIEPHRKVPYVGAQVRKDGTFRACVSIGHRIVHIGTYRDPRLASLAYNAALWLMGERPIGIDPHYFEQPHGEQLRNFMVKIAERIGRPYVPPQHRLKNP